jgi:hypothetical protein
VAVGNASGAFGGEYFNNNGASLNSFFALPIKFSVSKRSAPTVVIYSPITGASGKVATNASGNTDANGVAATAYHSGFSGGLSGAPTATASLFCFNWTAASEC